MARQFQCSSNQPRTILSYRWMHEVIICTQDMLSRWQRRKFKKNYERPLPPYVVEGINYRVDCKYLVELVLRKSQVWLLVAPSFSFQIWAISVVIFACSAKHRNEASFNLFRRPINIPPINSNFDYDLVQTKSPIEWQETLHSTCRYGLHIWVGEP